VIPSGIDPARFAAADRNRGRQGLGLAEGDLMVLCVAALTEDKDHRALLAAWREIAAARPRAHLLLAGEGGLRHELTGLAAGSPRVRFLGFRDDIPDLLAAADVFVLASRHEGLGTTIMDAACCRLPVVATRTGGIPELVSDGVDGLLVPLGDAAALGQALARCLDEPALRERLGAAAAQTAATRFHASAMVEAYAGIYDRVQRDA
jgi:glycosyltransferase involved in cell wall biosynthesis